MGKRVGKGTGGLYPRKRIYRARAHGNPFSDALFPVPLSPDEVNWADHFPDIVQDETASGQQPEEEKHVVRFVDVGCGFGGLLMRLSTMYPEKLVLGLELRDKVTEFVKQRIVALRQQHPGQYRNVSCARTNAQKYLPNYFRKGQLEKMFFLFPDPHFKVANHRRRVISSNLLTEYAYFLDNCGMLYTITDVQELGEWMKEKLDAHPLFEPCTNEELKIDPIMEILAESSEEGQKVQRAGGQTFTAVYKRVKWSDGGQKCIEVTPEGEHLPGFHLDLGVFSN